MTYVSADDIKAIGSKLSNDMRNDMESIADWMDENEFKGETETLLFGTTKRLTKLNEPLSVNYK